MIKIICLVNSIGKMLNTRVEKCNHRCSRNFGQNGPELNEKKMMCWKKFFSKVLQCVKLEKNK